MIFQRYKLHKYADYEEYRRIQTEGNKRKINNVWAVEDNIKFLSEILKERNPKFGLCHGTRRGLEQEWFSKYLGCPVLGTEISDTATQFPNTIQWDFHEVKPEWNRSVDFIYSNSFDHSYDPEKCLRAWISCLSPKGVCIIEHTSGHTKRWTSKLDPFGASLRQMRKLIDKWGNNIFGVSEVIKAPKTPNSTKYAYFLFVEIYPFWQDIARRPG